MQTTTQQQGLTFVCKGHRVFACLRWGRQWVLAVGPLWIVAISCSNLRICGRPAAWPAGCEARAGIFYFGNVVGIIYFEGGAVIFYFEGAVGIIYFEGGVFIFYFEGAVGIICFGNAGGLIFFEKARYIFGCKGAGYIVYSENAYSVREYEGVDIGGFGGLRGVGGFGGIGGVGGFVCSMVSKCHSEDSGVQCIRGVGFTYHRQNLLRRCVR